MYKNNTQKSSESKTKKSDLVVHIIKSNLESANLVIDNIVRDMMAKRPLSPSSPNFSSNFYDHILNKDRGSPINYGRTIIPESLKVIANEEMDHPSISYVTIPNRALIDQIAQYEELEEVGPEYK